MARGFPATVLAILGSVGLLITTYLAAQLHPLTDTQLKGGDKHLVELLAFAGAALLLCDTVRNRKTLERVLFTVVLAGGLVAIIGILQFVFEFDLASSLRPPGFTASTVGFIYTRSGFAASPVQPAIRSSSVSCARLSFRWPCIFARHALSSMMRTLSSIAAVLLAVVIPMALSRSAIVALVVIAVIMIPSWPSDRRWKAVIAGAAVAGLLTVIAPGLLSTTNDLINGDQGAQSLAYRDQANEQAYKLAGERPWFGSGYGTFNSDDQFILDNTYLTMMVEGGATGILALVVLMLVPAGVAIGVRRRTRDPAARDLAQTLLAMLLAVAVAGWGLTFLGYPLLSGLLFITIGAVGALARMVPARPLEPASQVPAAPSV